MGVLIEGLHLPSCCDDCWALDDNGDYPMCRITGDQKGYTFRVREMRMPSCPLVEVLDAECDGDRCPIDLKETGDV